MGEAPFFAPHLEILPQLQRLMWAELNDVPPEFVLYGDTALALHLAHRQSIDFDFFGSQPFDTMALYQEIPFLAGSQIIQQGKNTLTCLVDRGGEIKFSFFGVPHIRQIKPPHLADNGLNIASLIDLAGTKAAVVQQRAEAKDYIDIAALPEHGIDLPNALAAAKFIYGQGFNPQITLKALSFFDDGDLHKLPNETKNRLVRAVAAVDLGALPILQIEHRQ
jgi:hypothetical protein